MTSLDAPARTAFWAITLTFVAGWVNTGGYVWAGRVLSGNMSGDTVESALYALTGHSAQAWLRATALLCFLAGLLACRFIHEALDRKQWSSSASITFTLEFALIACATWLLHYDSHRSRTIIALLAFALGLQNATLTHIGILSIRTTHVTGTISHFAESFADYVFWLRDRSRNSAAGAWWAQPSFQAAVISFALWSAFFLGALCFLLAQTRMGFLALLPPMALLALAILSDVRNPLPRRSERSSPPT